MFLFSSLNYRYRNYPGAGDVRGRVVVVVVVLLLCFDWIVIVIYYRLTHILFIISFIFSQWRAPEEYFDVRLFVFVVVFFFYILLQPNPCFAVHRLRFFSIHWMKRLTFGPWETTLYVFYFSRLSGGMQLIEQYCSSFCLNHIRHR